MPVDERVRAAIEALGVTADVVECDEALADTAAFCAAYGYAESESANCILVAAKSDPPSFAACLVLATTRLDVNQVVRKRLGVKRASFATADQTVEVTGMRIGGVTPFGLPAGLPLWVDARILDLPRTVIGGGTRSAKLVLAPAELRKIPGAEVVEGLAKEVQATAATSGSRP